MKTGEAAKILDVTNNTIRAWIDHETLSRFFSPAARGETGSSHRRLTNDDLLVLNTIRYMRNNKKIDDWDQIASYLDTGQREQEFSTAAIDADMRTIPMPQAEQSARAAATLAERDAAFVRVKELEDELSKEREKHKEETDALHDELRRLERMIGRLEATIELLKEQGEV